MHWFFGVDLIQDRRSGMDAVLADERVVLDPVYRVAAALIPALQAHPEAETIFAALLYLGTTEGDMVMCARNKDRLPRGWRSRWEFADKLEGRLPAVGDALYDRWVATVDDMPRPHYEAETMRDFLGDPNIGGSIDSFPVACHRKLGKKQKLVRLFKVNPHYHAGVKGQAISKVIFRVNNRGLFADLRGPLFPQHDKYLLADSGMLETLATDPKLRNFLWLGDTHIIGPMMVTPSRTGSSCRSSNIRPPPQPEFAIAVRSWRLLPRCSDWRGWQRAPKSPSCIDGWRRRRVMRRRSGSGSC